MIKLIHGNCLEVMKELEPGSVDLCLADPPFGVTRRNRWDNVIPLDLMWERLHVLVKPTTPIVLHCLQPYTTELIASNRKEFKYLWYWDKHLKTGFLNAKKQPLRQVEEIAVFYKKQCRFTPPSRIGKVHLRNKPENIPSTNYGEQKNRGTTITDVYCATTLIQDYPREIFKTGHPTQKPVKLLEYLIRTYTTEGDTVLDFCMGSGSTGIACLNTNRNFVGIELDDHYFEVAKERIEAHEKSIADSNSGIHGNIGISGSVGKIP